MFKSVFEILKKFYDVLFEKFFNQLEFDKILTDTQTSFERIIITVKHQVYEQTRALKNLIDVDFQTKNQIVEFLKKEHDAFETRFLIKIQKKHNIETFRTIKKHSYVKKSMIDFIKTLQFSSRKHFSTLFTKKKSMNVNCRRSSIEKRRHENVHSLF